VKLLLENWRKYLLKEQTELWGYDIHPNQKVFVSKEPFTGFRNVQQDTPESKWEKPQGLWYGCGDAWIEWLGWEQRDWLEASRYLYEIKPAGKILQISNTDEFNKLESDFGFHPGDGAISGIGIDWKKMQDAGFAGIEICPYMGAATDGTVDGMWHRGAFGILLESQMLFCWLNSRKDGRRPIRTGIFNEILSFNDAWCG